MESAASTDGSPTDAASDSTGYFPPHSAEGNYSGDFCPNISYGQLETDLKSVASLSCPVPAREETVPQTVSNVQPAQKRSRLCARCRNHGFRRLLKGHKTSCPFKNCLCIRCLWLKQANQRARTSKKQRDGFEKRQKMACPSLSPKKLSLPSGSCQLAFVDAVAAQPEPVANANSPAIAMLMPEPAANANSPAIAVSMPEPTAANANSPAIAMSMPEPTAANANSPAIAMSVQHPVNSQLIPRWPRSLVIQQCRNILCTVCRNYAEIESTLYSYMALSLFNEGLGEVPSGVYDPENYENLTLRNPSGEYVIYNVYKQLTPFVPTSPPTYYINIVCPR